MRVNDDFEFERDGTSWTLKQYGDRTNRETQQVTRGVIRTTYHANLSQVCDAIIDRSAGTADTLSGIVSAIERAGRECAAALGVTR